MRRENRDQRFSGQIKKGSNESEFFKQPVKSFFGHSFNKFIIWVPTLIVGLLAFPFAARSVIAETIFLFFTVILSITLIKSRSGATILRVWVIMVAMLIFAATCPFIVFPKPIYIAVLESDNPLKARIQILESGEKEIGSTFLISDLDFFRQGITAFLRKLSPINFRVLQRGTLSNGSYYFLPVFEGLIFNPSEPGEFPIHKSLYFPLDARNYRFNLNLIKPDILSPNLEINDNYFDFSSGVRLVPLIDFDYDQYPETIPWEAVQVRQGQEFQVLNYAALLDRSLECFAVGKSEDGLNGLETAANYVPPDNLEGARLALLKYAFVQLSFDGNVGELQSLPFLHKAYDIFLSSRNDPRFSEKDPLTNWLRQFLQGSYSEWAWTPAFLDREAILNSMPHVDDDQRSYTHTLRNRFGDKSYDDLIKLLQLEKYSSAELHFIRNVVFEKFVTQAIGDFQLRTNSESESAWAVILARDAKKAHLVIKVVDSLLPRKGELQANPKSDQFIEFFANDFSKFLNTTNQNDTKNFILLNSKIGSLFGFFTNSIFASLLDRRTNAFPEMKNSQWWKIEYIAWFSCWSLNAANEIYDFNYPWNASASFDFPKVNVRELITKYGNDYLTKDEGGSGRTFLPGLFFLAWYSQVFGFNDTEKLKQQFEVETQIPFDVYLSKLFVGRSTREQSQSH